MIFLDTFEQSGSDQIDKELYHKAIDDAIPGDDMTDSLHSLFDEDESPMLTKQQIHDRLAYLLRNQLDQLSVDTHEYGANG